MIKSIEPRALFCLVSWCVYSRSLSCPSAGAAACEFWGSRKQRLVKMNCHVRLTDTYNEISTRLFQRGNVGKKSGANPLTLSWTKLCFPSHYLFFFLSYNSHAVIFCYWCGLRVTNETGKANDRWLLFFPTFFVTCLITLPRAQGYSRISLQTTPVFPRQRPPKRPKSGGCVGRS